MSQADEGPRTGVYPGTFDPLTVGHLDIITRALRVVDRLIVGVAVNAGKKPLFSVAERVEMVETTVANLPNGYDSRIVVRSFDNLLTDFVNAMGAGIIIRGLRAVSDFEYEFQMAGMNARLNPDVETVFLTASENNHFIASKLVKEVARLGGDITPFVTPAVRARMLEKLASGPVD
jgi:pantetheine-phosphate adenylyltransferase